MSTFNVMPDRNKMNSCPLCDGKLKRETRLRECKYNGIPYSYRQIGDWCDDCGEAFFSSQDLKITKKIRMQKKQVIDRVLSGAMEIHFKGFTSRIKYDKENKILYGQIVNSKAIIHSRGKNMEEIKQSFKKGVKAYLAAKEEIEND